MIFDTVNKIKSKLNQNEKNESINPTNNSYINNSFLKQLPMAVAVFDTNGNYLFVNDKYINNKSHKKIIIGKNDFYYFQLIDVDPDCAAKRNKYFNQALKEKRMIRFTEKLKIGNKKIKYFTRFFQPIIANDNITEIHFYGIDLTALMLAQKELKYLAYHDYLTSLKNRDAFYEYIDQLLIEKKQNNSMQDAILFCELENLGLVNDAYGHNIGDKLLKEASYRLRDVLNRSDLIFRIGGDEFAIILKNKKNELEIGRVAENVIKVCSDQYKINSHIIPNISVNIGIAVVLKDGKKRDTLLKHAEKAILNSKKSGKNTFQFYSKSITESSVKKLKIENYLQELVRENDFENQFDVLYQPIVEKKPEKDYRVIGAEALLRWNNPKIGWVMPDTFIPIAEESDLISNIGDWVLLKAATEFQVLQNKTDFPLTLSVNFSAKQMRSASASDKVEAIVSSVGIEPKSLQLELTETNYLDEHEDINNNIAAFRNFGVKLAIDDFGVGFASLSYLHKVPASTIKIDKSFIRYFSTRKEHRELVRSIIVLGENLEKDVIAEGVEQVEDLFLLDSQKCYKYQGFLFSKPLNISDFEKYLSKQTLLTTVFE